jgi:hypothetical protein
VGVSRFAVFVSASDRLGYALEMAEKSVSVAYGLWFFLGLFGVHHFYLNRDKHCFIGL